MKLPQSLKEAPHPNGVRVVELGEKALLACLSEIPFVRFEPPQREVDLGRKQIDILCRVSGPNQDRVLVAEVKTAGQPRQAREAIHQLCAVIRSMPNAYGVFIAPYISPRTAEICAEEGIGYVDLAGNCRLSFDQIYIRKEGQPNPFIQKRDLRSLYAPKAERVLRVLMTHPHRDWKLTTLAREAKVSLGQAHNVKKLLLDREWVREESQGLRLSEPGSLLHNWAENYDGRRHHARDFYSMESVEELEGRLATEGPSCALTGLSGAARMAPFVRYQRATAYVSGSVDNVAQRLGAREVSSGAILRLIEPCDDGVFYGVHDVDGVSVVSPVQLYLDVRSTPGRGEEAADALLEQVIKPQWQVPGQTTTQTW
jgi:hypothetical protein